jgi:hypothetical protein
MRDRVVRRGEGLRKEGAQAMAQAAREDQQDQAGEAEARAAGRARVREHLVSPLAGLERPRKMTAAERDAALGRLADKLAYMTPAALDGLAELALRHAGMVAGKGGVPRLPEEGMILAWAYAVQCPPSRLSAFVASVLGSRLGEEARDGGWLVELYREVRRVVAPPPKSDYAKGLLRDAAAENARRLERVRERNGNGVASPEDMRWLAAWHDDLRAAEALVAEGCARREALAATGVAA